jgi:hypothetical protein
MNTVVIMCYTIWGARNNLIFRGIGPNLQDSKDAFNKEMALTSLRAKESCSEDFRIWIQSWLYS